MPWRPQPLHNSLDLNHDPTWWLRFPLPQQMAYKFYLFFLYRIRQVGQYLTLDIVSMIIPVKTTHVIGGHERFRDRAVNVRENRESLMHVL